MNRYEEHYGNCTLKKGGLYFEGRFISEISPKVLRREKVHSAYDESQLQERYLICMRNLAELETDGKVKEYGFGYVNGFSKKLDYFESWNCPDAFISDEVRKHHIQKMQEEILQITEYTHIVDGDSALIEVEGQAAYVLGDEIIMDSNGMKIDCKVQDGSFKLKNKKLSEIELKEYVKDKLQQYISFWPGVTEILFYASLWGIARHFVPQNELVERSFCPMVVGPRGHLKTTLVRKYCLWRENSDSQKDLMQSVKSTALKTKLRTVKAQNYLLDDLHKLADYNRKNKMECQLDEIVRWVTSNSCGMPNIFFTGESLYDMGITSCIDRILEIQIPQLEADQLMQKKNDVQMLDCEYMPEVARFFCLQLIRNVDKVVPEIIGYLNTAYKTTQGNALYRTTSHGVFIKLTEHLFCKFCFDNDEQLTKREELNIALDNNRQNQEKKLEKMSHPTDYVFELGCILTADGDNPYIEVIPFNHTVQYNPDNIDTCLLKSDMFYITPCAALNCLEKKLNESVSRKLLLEQLKRKNMLKTDSSGKYMKRAQKNHYAIKAYTLKDYVDEERRKLTSHV